MSYGPLPTPGALRAVTPRRSRRPVAIARARGPADVARAAMRLALAVALGGALGAGAAAVGERAEPAAAAASVAYVAPAAPPPAVLFAQLDATLAVAIEQGQLAALQANDVALRAFAVQQVGRYEELRADLRTLAGRIGVAGAGAAGVAVGRPVAAHDDSLEALKVARGARFDRAYVRQALDVHDALLTDLDAALRIVENAEVRQALEELRGTMDADRPGGMRPR